MVDQDEFSAAYTDFDAVELGIIVNLKTLRKSAYANEYRWTAMADSKRSSGCSGNRIDNNWPRREFAALPPFDPVAIQHPRDSADSALSRSSSVARPPA
jgi:hypothetical protein